MPSDPLALVLSRGRRRIFRNYRVVRFGLVGMMLGGLILLLGIVAAPLLRLGREFLVGPVNVFSITLGGGEELKSTDGRTNILFLGIGGGSHDAPNLSDTMIIVSLKTDLGGNQTAANEPITLISIPRDIYLDSLGDKINSAYETGAERSTDAGMSLAKGAVSQVTGLPIHYVVRGDFVAFEKIIDLIGGIDVTVEHTFDDYKYPRPLSEVKDCQGDEEAPCWYEHIHFEMGPTHMDGRTALKFVRSRHADGDEGTDFARSRRQQLVISAVKKKVFSSQALLDLSKLEQIYNTLKEHLATDADPSLARNFFDLAIRYRGAILQSVILDMNLLDNPPIDERGWILVPKGGSWDGVHEYIKEQLGLEQKESSG
ncbi:MAG: Cell envelope-related transcriptional attenuator [Microgenomates group bacterium GW2011_GWA1_48_10]|nr:MAG: Cell envelope-related transcriptional attenuator [Microgenomates group bacterium GW2011_GWA1_48_10]